MLKLLCDGDQSVMGATLPFYRELAEKETQKVKRIPEGITKLERQALYCTTNLILPKTLICL